MAATVTDVRVKQRPFLVTILAILLMIWGAILVAGGFGLLFFSWWTEFGKYYEIAGLTGPLAGLVTILVGLLYIGIFLGLWRMRFWAWILAVIASFAWLIGTANSLSTTNPAWLGLVISILFIVYLFLILGRFRGKPVTA